MPKLTEIKAHCSNPQQIASILEEAGATFKGIDHQIDTYFMTERGRLKLREGNIENTLIHYIRPNQAGPKNSKVTLYKPQNAAALKAVLLEAYDLKVVVDKKRGIYFIDNVKFHIDEVKGLGSFVEIEAIDDAETMEEAVLLKQCKHYINLLGIQAKDLLEVSYSDMLLEKGK
ncbi:MAG: adenylate cyclase class 2 [Polaribacter sp.]|jgi:adenylate cyclase class 2